MENNIRLGKISAIDYAAGTVRVVYHEKDDAVTAPIPLISSEYFMPEVDDMVNPVSCAGSKQFRRTPTPQLYGGRILFYDKRTAPRGALQTPPDKAAGKAKGPQRRPGAD